MLVNVALPCYPEPQEVDFRVKEGEKSGGVPKFFFFFFFLIRRDKSTISKINWEYKSMKVKMSQLILVLLCFKCL